MVNVSDIHWLAGFFDGEACFRFSVNACRVNTVQKESWPLLKAQSIVGGNMIRIKGGLNRKYWLLSIVGKRAAGVMMTLYPLLSPRRQNKIKECLAQWRQVKNRGYSNYTNVCKRGHVRTPENQGFKSEGRGRYCKPCNRERHQERKASKTN